MLKLKLFIILFCISKINYSFALNISNKTSNLSQSSHQVKSSSDEIDLNIFQYSIENLNSTLNRNVNDELCLKELNTIKNNLNLTNFELWAFKFPDSWGKIPSGILMGHTTDLGNFDECVEISQIIDNKTQKHLLEGKYCFAQLPIDAILNRLKFGKIKPRMGFNSAQDAGKNLKIGICFPKTCRPEIIDDILRNFLQGLDIHLDDKKAIIQPQSCKTKLILNFRTVDIVAISLFSLIGFLMVISTVYDYAMILKEKQPIKILIAFSVISNGQKLFRIDKQKSNRNVIECLNGIRCFSIIWVVFGHQYFMSTTVSSINAVDLLEWARSPFSLLITNGVLAVDSFFLLSGCLLTWSAFRTMEKSNGRLNILKMYLHRYLRLTPFLALMVLFQASIQRYLGSGPFWNYDIIEKFCQENWWSTLLYVNNYVHPNRMCYGLSWYLSVDTQLFVLSPLILIPLWKWGKIAFLPIIVAIQASVGYVFAEWIYREYHYLPLESNEKDATKQEYTYFATHARVSPYLIGIILGYYLYQYRNKTIRLSKNIVAIGWICCLTIMAAIIFGPYHRSSQQPVSGMTTVESALLESLSRLSWAIALSWIIFACHHGFGGLVNKILTFGVWQPLARLSYGIYLTHMIVQICWYGNYRIEQYFSDMDLIFIFWGCFGITLCVTVILVLAFESPIIILESLLFGNVLKNIKNVNSSSNPIAGPSYHIS